MNKQINNTIREITKNEYPRESCGGIYVNKKNSKYEVVQCENIAQDKIRSFEINEKTYYVENANIYGKPVVLFHSHCYSRAKENPNEGFSEQDIKLCNEMQIPFLLHVWPDDEFYYLEPEDYQHEKLTGRPFIRGFWDCYCGLRDFFKEHGVNISYYFPPADDALNDYDLFEKNFKKEGFYKIEPSEAKYGDVFMFKVGKSKTVNHVAVFLGGSKIFHHPFNSESVICDMDDRLMKYSFMVVRHKDFKNG